jgi:AhpD family alkylhydroperoxidase
MSQRLNYASQSQDQFKKLADFAAATRHASIEENLISLVEIRASQLNGCAFCVDMHVKQATMHGERALRLHHVAVWHESPLFDQRERAALAWTEAVTHLPEKGITDGLFEEMKQVFSDKEISDLTFAIVTINAWNRLGVAFRAVPGSADRVYGLDKAGLN